MAPYPFQNPWYATDLGNWFGNNYKLIDHKIFFITYFLQIFKNIQKIYSGFKRKLAKNLLPDAYIVYMHLKISTIYLSSIEL